MVRLMARLMVRRIVIQMIKPLPAVVMALTALLCAGSSTAHAHGAGWQVTDNSHTINYRFGYTDGTPMAFAEVIVIGPNGKTWQKARTDRTGHFAFGVDRETIGEDISDALSNGWQIKVADGMGHIVNLTHHAPELGPNDTTATKASPTKPHTSLRGTSALFDLPVWAGALFGMSLLVNLFGGVFLWSRRVKPT